MHITFDQTWLVTVDLVLALIIMVVIILRWIVAFIGHASPPPKP